MKYVRVALLCVVSVVLSESAIAAPFCAVFSYGKQCYYYSYNDCLRAAGRQGACVTNDEEVRAQSVAPHFVWLHHTALSVSTTMQSHVVSLP